MGRDVLHLINPFHHRNETRLWQSEFWGKWFTAAVLAYRYNPTDELKIKLKNAIDELIKTQSEDGYIGNYAVDQRLNQWDIWGRKYTLLGLLAYYELTEDKSYLSAAVKVADHLMYELEQQGGVIVNKGNYRGMAASSVLEPICLLFRLTKQKKYLDFAEEIVRQWETAEGPRLISKAGIDVAFRFPKPETNWYSWEQGQKAYEMMSCYEGLLELYRITGKNEYRDAVEKVWDNIKETEINLVGSGAAAEMWFGGRTRQVSPVLNYQETCVTVTWIKLSHQLLRLTGDAKYADAVEQSFYNALLGSAGPNNHKWAMYTPLVGQRLEGRGQCGMDINCCEANGPRGMFNLPGHIVMSSSTGLAINYYVPGVYGVKYNGTQVTLQQKTDYPRNGQVKIRVGLASSSLFEIKVRVPAWSARSTIRINDEQFAVEDDGYVSIERLWNDGDEIEIELDMRGRLTRLNGYFAIVRGPVVLARDSELVGPNLIATLEPVLDDEGFIELEPSNHSNSNKWMNFDAQFLPEFYSGSEPEPIAVTLCDYGSAGYRDESVYRVWTPELHNLRKGD